MNPYSYWSEKLDDEILTTKAAHKPDNVNALSTENVQEAQRIEKETECCQSFWEPRKSENKDEIEVLPGAQNLSVEQCEVDWMLIHTALETPNNLCEKENCEIPAPEGMTATHTSTGKLIAPTIYLYDEVMELKSPTKNADKAKNLLTCIKNASNITKPQFGYNSHEIIAKGTKNLGYNLSDHEIKELSNLLMRSLGVDGYLKIISGRDKVINIPPIYNIPDEVREAYKKKGVILRSGYGINIKDYGAVGDGETDDSESIRKAIADASDINGTVYIPKGKYKVSTDVYTPSQKKEKLKCELQELISTIENEDVIIERHHLTLALRLISKLFDIKTF